MARPCPHRQSKPSIACENLLICSLLQGTVLLNANMGFLAIGIVDQNRLVFRSAAQISSYLSIVASIGSILLALLLLRQNNTKLKETANDVVCRLLSALETIAKHRYPSSHSKIF